MIKHLLKLFVVCVMCWSYVVSAAGGLPALPPLPALADLPPLPSSGSSSMAIDTSFQKAVSSDSSVSSRSNVLDTESLDTEGKDLSGSWFKKRHWSIKARDLQEKINSLVSDVQGLGGPLYDTKRSTFNKDVSTFYEKIGMEQGKVDTLLEELAPYFNPASKDVSVRSVSHLSSSKKFQDYFDATVMVAQLKSDLKAIADLDAGISERVAQFEKCSQQAIQKASEAQSIINEMFAFVNHEAARDSYYKLEGIVSYLEAVLKFAKNDLASDFDRVVGLARTKMDDVSKVVSSARAACDALRKPAATDDKKEPDKKVEKQPDNLKKTEETQPLGEVSVASSVDKKNDDPVEHPQVEDESPVGFIEKMKRFLMSLF